MRAHQLEFKFLQGDLFEEVCEIHNLVTAFKLVKRNKGAPGVDGVTIDKYETNLQEEVARLRQEVLEWSYQPTPVKRVEIPKPNGKGVRLLGIPTVKDRVLHMAIKQVLEPIIDLTFSDNSYGFRPGRSQRDAVEAARDIVQSGKEYVVDIDLSKFFDRINHNRLIHRLGKLINDKRILRLVGMILRSGIMTEDGLIKPEEGSVQGSPLSPLLSNVVLDELDKELERRGLQFCRYADDCNIFVKTERAAARVKEKITKFIEKKLKLKVNDEKSKTAKSDKVKFLGMTIVNGLIAISKAAMKHANEMVKALIPRRSHLTIEETMKRVNRWYTGWSGYFKMTQYPSQLQTIEAHIRRRLRATFVIQLKRPLFLFRVYAKRGVSIETAKRSAYSGRKVWHKSNCPASRIAWSNRFFIDELKQTIVSDSKLPGWLPVKSWVKLT
jgi:group II intron reverse transcriptase/maturase